MTPLWRRALDARELAQRQARDRSYAATQLAVRKNPRPKVGDVFGGVRVVADLGSGRLGRSDSSFEVVCLTCGRRGPVFEFNLRKGISCVGRGRQPHSKTAEV